MDILKSYAHQVVSYHPEKTRDDMFAELYDELCEEFSDWQELNPEGNDTQFLESNKPHPMRLAARLAPENSAYLIGPQFYYSFVSALKIGAVVTCIVYLVIAAVSALASGSYFSSFFKVLTSIPMTLIWVSASILGVFIAIEKSGEKASWLDNWKVSRLRLANGHKNISKTETFFDLAVSTLALLWLWGLVQIPEIIGRDGIVISDWTIHVPAWFWIVLGIMLVLDIAFCLVKMLSNTWSPRLRLTSILNNVAWMALLFIAAAKTPLLTLPDNSSAEIIDLLPIINNAIRGVLIVICIILFADSLNHGWKLFKGRPHRPSRDEVAELNNAKPSGSNPS